MSILTLFERLQDSISTHMFTVSEVSGYNGVFLGIDKAGHPGLFVRSDEQSFGPPLRTSQVSLQFRQQYTVAGIGEESRKEVLNALCCEASGATEIDTFLVLIEAFLARYHNKSINHEMLKSFFRSMARLFSIPTARDLRSEQQGLWGELFVMNQVRGFEFWVPFWRSESTRRFDFSDLNKRVEVKTAIGTSRIHHFSHRQIYALKDENIVIASLLLREEEAGLSLRELISEARSKLRQNEHFIKIERAVRQAGMDSIDEVGPIYDPLEAQITLAWFHSTDAPHFRMPEPPGVSLTQYRVDLSTATQLHTQELNEWLDLWSMPASAT